MAHHQLHLTEIDPSTLTQAQKSHAIALPAGERHKDKNGGLTINLSDEQMKRLNKHKTCYLIPV